jgi:hypothetical protein
VSGALSPKDPPTIAGARGGAIRGPALSPDGKSLYVPNPFDDTLSQYDIDPLSGKLSPKTPATVAGPRPTAVAVTPDGTSAYVTGGLFGTVSQYDIDPASGTLAPKSPPSVPSGLAPGGIAVLQPPKVPTSNEQCKHGGWRNFLGFKNEGDCVSYVATGGKNQPGGP